MTELKFILNQPIPLEETRHCEFKEIKGSNPIDAIKNTADEYVVAFLNSEGGQIFWGIRDSDRVAVGVKLSAKQRDEIRRSVCEKLAQIQPIITPTAYRIILHEVYESDNSIITVPDIFIVEITTPRTFTRQLYFTGSSVAFVKTDAGKKKLTGAELNDELYRRLQTNSTNGANGDETKIVGEELHKAQVEYSMTEAVVATERLREMFAIYESQLQEKVSKVKIFGDLAQYPLDKVFVELNISEEYNPHMGAFQYLGLLDAELRQLRMVFSGTSSDYLGEDSELSKAILNRSKKIKPDDILNGPTHAIITGAPGCGKTTLLRYLTWQTLKRWREIRDNHVGNYPGTQSSINLSDRVYFPIFLEFKQLSVGSFAQQQDNFEDILFDRCIVATIKPQDQVERNALKQHFNKLLSRGCVAVFLDGLDEVSGARHISELQASISTFLQSAYQNNLVIISTRPFAVRQIGNAQIMEIDPLNASQIEQFINHYYGKTSESREFQEELQRRRELRELARVPALLGFILQMWRADGLVSNSKIELYDAISRELAQQLDSDKEGIPPERKWLVTDPDGSLKHDFMRQLAFESLFSGVADTNQGVRKDLDRLIFSSDRILKIARHFAKRIESLENISVNPRHLAEDAKATALLRQIGADRYAFTHLTLHEYLAAIELAERADCEQVFCRAYFNPMIVGMEVLPITLGISNSPNQLCRSINLLPESLNFTGMHLLARSLNYESMISDDVLQELTERLVSFILLYDIDIEKSELTESYTWLRKRPLYCKRFVPLLKDEDATVRYRVAALFGLIGSNQVVPELLDALSDENERVRAKVAIALGSIGDKKAIPKLSKMIEDDAQNFSHYWKALRKLGKPVYVDMTKVEKVQELVWQSPLDGEIKRILIQELSMQGLSDELRNVIKNYCLEGVKLIDAQIEEESSKINNLPALTIPELVKAAWETSSVELRNEALALLKEIGTDDNIAELLERELILDDVRRREVAAQALMRMDEERAVIALLKALSDKSSSVRWIALKGLAQMKPETVISGLAKAISHVDPFVRGKAVQVIGYYKMEDVNQELSQLVASDPNYEIRKIAQEGLHRFEFKLQYFNPS